MELFNISKLLFTDVDTVWLADPVLFFQAGYDMIASVDAYVDNKPYYCGGFVAYISTGETWQFLRAWQSELDKEPQHNQPVLNSLLPTSGVKVLALPSLQFPSGKLYFEEKIRKYAIVVHANFMVGKERKINSLKTAHLWYL